MDPAGPAAPPAPAKARPSAVTKTRRLLLLLTLFLLLATGVSLVVDLRGTAQRHEQLALEACRANFQQAVLTRRWNAKHGGVYVPVTPSTPPNPYLEEAGRDLVLTDGRRLTKLNPAYMTREISTVMGEDRGVQLHITSLKPIRPENAADEWERQVLASFEQGARESFTVSGTGPGAVFRYMAPLMTEESCLECHAVQGYRLGDVRGGISVSLPYAPFRSGLAKANRATIVAHLLFLAIGVGLVAVLGRSLLARVGELQQSLDRIRKLEGLLPICAGCKRIRTAGGDYRDQAAWEQIESYISSRSEATFTHGLCPECAKRYFGDEAR